MHQEHDKNGIFFSDGLVTGIEKGGQAEELGVKLRWSFDTIEGQPYHEKLLERYIDSGKAYTVTFLDERQLKNKADAG